MADLPSGTVTFLFTDIEGSTKLLQQLGDGYEAAISEHRKLLREAFAAHNGHEMGTEGDSFAIAFAKASDGVGAALAGQLSLTSREWDHEPIRVRMGVHTGEVQMRDGDYFGLAVHQAARVGAAAHGGQVLVSQTTRDLVAGTLPGDAQLVDLGEHRLKDITEPIRLFNLTHPGLQAAFLPPRTLSVLPNNLPVQLTSFVGRDTEVADVRKLLDSGRLVTLTGAGGSGKTRLALEVAAEILDECRDGVWFIDLAPVIDEDFVPQVTARTLGLAEPSGQAITEEGAARAYIDRIVAHLSSKDLVLVLDNCEHLIAACAALGEQVLRSCPDVRVMATAREPLGIGGENVYRVPSLDLPEPDDSLDGLLACESIRLFCERARHVKTGFALSADNAPAVAKICRDLDGLPLGIELGAALVKAFSPAQIAKRLGDRFELLRGGSRTALERQQTLRAAVDWSYELLGDEERTLFRRLSVFVGGFSLEGAEAVCSDDNDVAPTEVLHILAQLVDRSMVQVDERGDETRYRLLETMRQYGREKLIESGEGPKLRDRHLEWFTAFGSEAEPHLERAEQLDWLARIDNEIDNVRAALDWASSDPTRSELGLRLGGALWWYWNIRSLRAEASARLEALLEADGEAPAAIRAKVHLALGQLSPSFDMHRAHVETAIPLAREAGDDVLLARALVLLAVVANDLDSALGALEEAERVARPLGNPTVDGEVAYFRYSALNRFGERARAIEECKRMSEIASSVEDRWTHAYILALVAYEALASGEHEEARRQIEEALVLFRELGDKPDTSRTLARIGMLESIEGNHEQASAVCREAVRIAREAGDVERLPECLLRMAEVLLHQGELAEAKGLLEEAMAFWRQQSRLYTMSARAMSYLALIALLQGNEEEARARAEEALDPAGARTWGQFVAYRCLARLIADPGAVRSHFRQARACLTAETCWEAAILLEEIAGMCLRDTVHGVAARVLGAAEALRAAIGAPVFPVDQSEVDRTIAACREALGVDGFDAELSAGRDLTPGAAFDLALVEKA